MGSVFLKPKPQQELEPVTLRFLPPPVIARRGPARIDSRSTGTFTRDFLSASDLAHLPEALALYDNDSEGDRVLYFGDTRPMKTRAAWGRVRE